MLNVITLQGRLTNNLELKRTTNGTAVCAFTIAVERDYRDQSSGKRESDFFDCVAWRNNAEFVSEHFNKGDMICITGRLQSRIYQDKEGNNRKAVEIVIDNEYFAGKKPEAKPEAQFPVDEFMDVPEEIPFN